MDNEVDLRIADRNVLIAIIVRQQAIIERLEKGMAQLEEPAKPAVPGGCLVLQSRLPLVG